MVIPYETELEKIRSFLEQKQEYFPIRERLSFPTGYCRQASCFSAYTLNKEFHNQIKIADGNFNPHHPEIGPSLSHSMAFDTTKGVFIDLTMDQFGSQFPQIYVGPQPEEFDILFNGVRGLVSVSSLGTQAHNFLEKTYQLYKQFKK